jgi:phosphonate transport system ATP-binding protein
VLDVADLTLRYRPDHAPALDGASLTAAPGEMIALLGPSGAGKSSLLRCISALIRPDAGTVAVGGQEVTCLAGAGLQSVRRQVALIFQDFQLIDRLSVQSNALTGRLGRYPFWRAALGLWRPADVADARQMLARVGLAGKEQVLARELSGGQRQRVAIARAMMQQPAILLGDEPVSSLDPVTARSILQLTADLTAEQGLTTILSLHDLALAREFCPRAVGVRAGRIVYDGPMEEVNADALTHIYGEASDGPAA